MIMTITLSLLIIMLVVYSWQIIYHLLYSKAQQNAEQTFQSKHQQLEAWQSDLLSQYAQFQQHKKTEENQIAQKKIELIKEQEEYLVLLQHKEQMNQALQYRIDVLQKRISQLQSELFQARRRAERLAKKLKNAV